MRTNPRFLLLLRMVLCTAHDEVMCLQVSQGFFKCQPVDSFIMADLGELPGYFQITVFQGFAGEAGGQSCSISNDSS